MFALNNAVCAAIVYLAVSLTSRDAKGRTPEQFIIMLLMLGAFSAGLALSNQHSSLLLLVMVVPMLWYRFRKEITLPVLGKLVLSGICGLLPYVYIFAAALSPKQGSWGSTGSIAGFLTHVMRAEYGTFQLGIIQGSENSIMRIYLYLKHVSVESYHILLPLAAFGIYAAMPMSSGGRIQSLGKKVETSDNLKGGRNLSGKKQSKPGKFPILISPGEIMICKGKEYKSESQRACMQMLIVCWIGYVLLWHCVFSNLPLHAPMPFAVHSRFWMQPNLLLAVIGGMGFGSLLQTVSSLSRVVKPPIAMTAVSVMLIVIISIRYQLLDRSADGWIMHSYGDHILRSVSSSDPKGNERPLLLSHTDLDWNSVRYLTSCEKSGEFNPLLGGLSEGVAHLNFQLMPYPWFPHTQAQFFPDVEFPQILPTVSTSRLDPNNAVLVSRFCDANLKTLVGSSAVRQKASSLKRDFLYLDMQAINERLIESGGMWGDFLLVSWGLVYKVVRKTTLYDSGFYHADSLNQLRHLEKASALGYLLHWDNELLDNSTVSSVILKKKAQLPIWKYPSKYRLSETQLRRSFIEPGENSVGFRFNAKKYPPGCWEWAAASVYMDAHYQLGEYLCWHTQVRLYILFVIFVFQACHCCHLLWTFQW